MFKGLDRMESLNEAIRWVKINIGYVKTRAEALKYLRCVIPDEGKYQTNIMKAIQKTYPTAFVWKAAAGPYSREGIPDIIASINGKFFAFEVKRPYFGEPSKIQLVTISKILCSGGHVGIVTFPEDALKIIEEGLDDEK